MKIPLQTPPLERNKIINIL